MSEKKRQRRKDARPDEIMTAALVEFAENGYGAASLGSIARRADIARSTIYLYFEDKDTLTRQIFQDRIGRVFEEAKQNAAQSSGPVEADFRKLLTLVYTRFIGSDALILLKILIAEGSRFPEMMQFYRATILQTADAMVKTLLQRGVDRGEVRPEVLDLDAKLLIAPVIASAVWKLTFDAIDPLDMDAFAKGHLQLLMHGITPYPQNADS